MAFQLSPGINVTETDLTTIVPSVGTTLAGVAGMFQWGPVAKRVLVDSVQNLRTLYGLPNDSNYKYWWTAANFLGYGNNLQVVRCVDESTAKNAGPGSLSVTLARHADDSLDVLTASTYGTIIAKYPGNLGNSLKVEFCGSIGGGLTGATFGSWAYKNQFNRQPGTSRYVEGLGGSNDEFHMLVIDEDGLWSGATGTVLERFEGLSLQNGAVSSDGTTIYFKDKINRESKYLAAIGSATTVTNLTTGYTCGLTSTQWTASGYTFVSGGVWSSSLQGGTGENTGESDLADTGQGFDLFSDPETVDVSLLLSGAINHANQSGVLSSLVSLVNARKDCLLFVSAPNMTGSNSDCYDRAIALRNAVGNSSYVVIDSSYKYQYDTFNDINRFVPLNGDIAGLCARTDQTNDPWWSPAGFNRGVIRNVIRLGYNPSQAERDNLYKNGVNPVATFPGEGTVLFGDKTAQTKPSAFDRINVRRLFIVLEKAIATAAKYQLFEFNDAFTRASFVNIVTPFLRAVQARRGITDFKVVCNETNNTAAVIDANQFVADIYVKPNRSINFISLNFVATRSGVSFEEVGA